MILALSLFWRTLLVQLVFTAIAVLSLNATTLMQESQFVQWKASVLFIVLAATHFGIQALTNRSPVEAIFGARLGITKQSWRTFSFALAGFYVALSGANALVALLASFDAWNTYKLVAPLVGLVAFTGAIPRWLEKQSA